MKLAIMQPYFFPYLGYFQLIHASDKFVFYDDVNFIRNGWINRNRLLLGAEPHYFTVPLAGASSFASIRETHFDAANTRWKRKMLATFEAAYKRSPERDAGLQLLEKTLAADTDLIGELARRSVRNVMEYLGLEREVVESSHAYANAQLKGTARVLDICRRDGADTYVNPPGGRELYDAAEFRAAGIELCFLESHFPPYAQGDAAFVPGLSILDAIMRCPRGALSGMLESYDVDHVPPR